MKNAIEPIYEVNRKYCVDGQEFAVRSMEMSNALNFSSSRYIIPFYNITLIPQNIHTYMSQQDILDNNFKYFKPSYVFNGIVGMYSRHLSYDIRFTIWRDMIYRCYRYKENTYKYFGGKGITVCDKWKVYKYFLYDWDCIENNKITNNVNATYVMQLKPRYYVYSLDTSYVTEYYNSDVCKAVQEIAAEKSAASFNNNKPKTSSPIHFYGDQVQQYQQQSVQNVPPPEQTAQNKLIMLDGSVVSMDSLATNPSLEDYQKVINDTSFMDELPEPGSGGSKTTYPFNPEHGPLTPYNSKRKKKDMCFVVDK